MKKNLYIILFIIPFVLTFIVLFCFQSWKGAYLKQSFSDILLLGFILCVIASSLGYFADMVYRGSTKGQSKTDKEFKILKRIFPSAVVGLFFSIGITWIYMDQQAAIKKCFEQYDDKGAIQHCIESGENIPEYNADF